MNDRLIRALARKYATPQLREEDLVQEGNLAFIKAEKTFDNKKGVPFDAYATHVIKNRFIDLLRKTHDTPAQFNDETMQSEINFDDEIKLIEIKKILLNSVAEIDRAIFNSYIEGFTYEEISKIFDLPRKKIDNTVQKVKKIIKEKMR